VTMRRATTLQRRAAFSHSLSLSQRRATDGDRKRVFFDPSIRGANRRSI
jgi:hypothetical protein